jgi:hypothetical protein
VVRNENSVSKTQAFRAVLISSSAFPVQKKVQPSFFTVSFPPGEGDSSQPPQKARRLPLFWVEWPSKIKQLEEFFYEIHE